LIEKFHDFQPRTLPGCGGFIVLVLFFFDRSKLQAGNRRMDVELEIDDLKRRVNDLEGAVNVLSGQFGKLHPELLAVKRQNIEGFDRVETAVSRVIVRLDTINTQVWSLRDDLPGVIQGMLAKDAGAGSDGSAG
jgi:hypothetical protein